MNGCDKVISKDIGIDLGTANVLIYIKGEGIVLNEPSVVAIETDTKNMVAVGKEAYEMLGRTPGKLKALRPIKDGVIADFEVAEMMLEAFIKKAMGKRNFTKPRILICCPSNVTQVEKNAIREAAERTGARKVYIEIEPKVAAVGAGVDISKPTANMIVDIGGGTTDVAVLSLNDMVTSASIKLAGHAFDQQIIKYIKDKNQLLIGDKTAEEIKIQLANVHNPDKKKKMEVKGRDLISGLPKTITINAEEVEEALHEGMSELVKTIKGVLEETPPELSADIVDKGIILTGGGALLKGIREVLQEQLKVPILIADSPLTCVAAGTGILLEDRKNLKEE